MDLGEAIVCSTYLISIQLHVYELKVNVCPLYIICMRVLKCMTNFCSTHALYTVVFNIFEISVLHIHYVLKSLVNLEFLLYTSTMYVSF